MSMARRVLPAILLCACAPGARDEVRLAEPAPPTRTSRAAAWRLTWHGAPIGAAWERDDGARFTRRERVIVRRGEAIVVSELRIEVERDGRGQPRTITVARWGDGPALTGRAVAVDGRWQVAVEGEPAVTLPAAAPFELVVRRAPGPAGFHGPVLLAGWGFARAELTLTRDPAATDRWHARLRAGGRQAEAHLRYDAGGALAEVTGGDGVVARAAPVDALRGPLVPDPVEVVGGNAIALVGAGAALAGVRFPDAVVGPPPALPGQRVHAEPRGWAVELAPVAGDGPRAAEIAALARAVAAEVDDDLGASATTTGAALTATRGDCTTHALRFAALAARAGIETRVVTGLRRDGDQLVRHRWNLAWTGTAWMPVDPTWAEAPARDVIGLAAHGARAADLAAADATVFDGLGARAIAR